MCYIIPCRDKRQSSQLFRDVLNGGPTTITTSPCAPLNAREGWRSLSFLWRQQSQTLLLAMESGGHVVFFSKVWIARNLPKPKTNRNKLTSAVKSWGALKKKNYTSSKLTAVLVFVGLQISFTSLNYMITIKQPWCQVLYTVKGQLGVPHLYPVTI